MIRQLLRPSLFRRILVWQFGVLLAALLINAWLNVSHAVKPGTGGVDQDLRLRAGAFARFSALDPTPAKAREVAAHVRALGQSDSGFQLDADEFAWQVWLSSGELLARDALSPSIALQPPGSLGTDARVERPGWRLMAARSPDGRVWAVIGMREAVFDRWYQAIFRNLGVVVLIYGAVVTLGLWLATWRGLRPLVQLGEQIKARDAGSREPLVALVAEPLELRPITSALNAYAGREAALRAQEKRFFADAAHELRTPLAVIGAQAHVLSQEHDPQRQTEALASLQTGVQRAGDVLSKVLMVSRLASTVPDPTSRTELDLGELLRERVSEHAQRALTSGHNLGLLDGPVLRVRADASLLATAIDNLIDNALRYSPSGSRIDVGWGRDGELVWWAVEDDGPGVAPDERERVFERFERGRAAESQSGSGLGLAIARAVAGQLGGELVLIGSARFEMRWPLASG